MNLAPISNPSAANNVKSAQDLAKVETAAKEFESVYIAEMLKPMFEGISTDGMFGGGKGEEVFRGQLLQEYGKLISNTGGLGITSWVKDAMIKMQEEANGENLNEQVTEAAPITNNNEVTTQ